MSQELLQQADEFIEQFEATEKPLAKCIKALADELRGKEKPDYFYNKDDWEVTHNDIDMLEDTMACEGIDIMRIGRLVELPEKFKVMLYNEDTDEAEYPEFNTLEEARAFHTKYALP